MRQTAHAVPGKMGLLLLLGTKFSETWKSCEMLRSISWGERFLTSPISPPTGLAPSISRCSGSPAQAGRRALACQPPLPGIHSGTWAARCRCQDRLPPAPKLAAHLSSSALQGRGQDFLGFKHLPSKIPSKIRDGPRKFPQCSWAGCR